MRITSSIYGMTEKQFTSVTGQTNEICQSVLENITEISIPSSELNVTGRNKSLTKTFNTANYLTDGVQLAEGEQDTVKVTVEIVATTEEE